MNIDYAITCVNEKRDYLEHLPIVSDMWKSLGVKVLIGRIKQTENHIELFDNLHIYRAGAYPSGDSRLLLSDFMCFKRFDSIDSGIQAKITRMWIASITQGNNMIVDADMIPLHSGIINCYKIAPEDHLVKFGCEHPVFSRRPDFDKWPMHQTAARNTTFKEIINPFGYDYSGWINWLSSESFPDDRANVTNGFSNFSDESLLKCLYDRWSHGNSRTTKIKRTEVSIGMNSHEVYGRICRVFNPSTEGIDVSKYFEVHGPRPFLDHLDWYQPIVDYIKRRANV